MDKIKVTNIKKTYENLDAINNISLSVANGQFISILGPSGCGKSTLLNIISGLEKPTSGDVLIDGESYIGKSGRVSYMHQKDLLLPWKNIIDNVSIPLVLQGLTREKARKRAMTYLDDFGLRGFEKVFPGQLSGGMRQRAALLRTYLFKSDVMLLDEPFGSLDAMTKRKMHLWLMDIFNNYKSSIIFITHDIDEAIFLSDKVYLLSERPAEVKIELDVDLERPRNNKTFSNPKYIMLKEKILNIL
ncbi:ABC-type nitrate/sulfonate/bicarbonate transport system, ATPase component [Desulfonispora thiosulfatigenes DSM 11270]|uniref:ABC-type nitrate/sulfonate/bicarbonate transport system, ATPase component n=1 Tax=Desulfonispora thiosulfatigenes DSM 11270 TaxID=656914 RepID=A0A1W1VCF2_DESTI|nr:ABC transporter ATP-binding protein [Desulfonispora thiosulfatigenes]SMB90731.1 ABC-type nitrate/sulfonate/bicarbonate transport system, ATPase component [Desulfonispora thiosulfatigenes DSM 11270]